MLGFTASFMLESDNPEWAVVPCLWIEDSVKRARAAIEIMDRLTYLGHPLEALQSIASAVINGYEDRQASMDRLLSGFREEQDDSSNSSHLKTYLLSPDVPEAILLADAICGRLAEVRDAYLGKSDESFQIESFRATASGYTNALAVGAVLYPEEFEQDLFEHAAEEQLSNVGNKLWSALHFANFLWRSGREQDATELLTKIVEQSSLIYESSDWEMYRGHVDAFHGTCDVGFTHAAVRALCIQMRATEALELVRRVSDTLAPEESMRALATISASNEDPTVERALKDLLTEVKEAAGSTSVDALHTLVDGDLDVYARTMSAALRRATSDRAIEALGSLSLLSWAAENRGDRPASEQLAVEVRQRFDGLSDDARRNVPTGRLVGNLLRARRSSAAVELMQLSHWRAGSSTETSGPPKDWPHWIANEVIDSLSVDGRIVELVGFLDLHPDVWRNELLRDLARSVLHESKLSPSLMERLADLDLSCHQFAGIVRIIRCGSDTDAARRLTDFARSAIRAGVKRAFKQVRSDGRRREAGEYYGGHRDFSSRIKDAEELALASAEVGMARQCERSLGLLGHFEYEQEMQSMGWDAFRGHLPSSDEISWESDREALKRCELNSRLASAFHRASCFQASRRYLSKATDGLSTIRTNELYARALEPLAVATVRCEDFHLMQSLLLQPMRATGTRVGVVVQLLVEHVLSVGHTSQASKEALNKLLAADNLANWDYLDAFGSIAVMAASDGDGIQRVILEALTSATAAR